LVDFTDDDYNTDYTKQRIRQKQCALICIEEIIHEIDCCDTLSQECGLSLTPTIQYWVDVKQEIENL
jgi:hypothetical protein